MESYFVYVLYTEKFDKYYVGQTNDIEARFERHNKGLVNSTTPYIPYCLIFVIQKGSRAEALELEKKIKNLSKKRILEFIAKYSSSNLVLTNRRLAAC